MNNVIYYESSYLKQQYITQWKNKGSIFHYELHEKQRLAAAIASQYFQFAVFIFDVFNADKQKLVSELMSWKQDMPFFIIANSFEQITNLENIEFQVENNLFYFQPSDIKDLPGIILRVLKQKMYYRRSLNRIKVNQVAELVIDNKSMRITLKDLSKSGARVELRRDPKTFTQKQATLIHTRFDGAQVKVPVEICWAMVASDGRLQLGTKFQKFH
jgi:hypothetical protein